MCLFYLFLVFVLFAAASTYCVRSACSARGRVASAPTRSARASHAIRGGLVSTKREGTNETSPYGNLSCVCVLLFTFFWICQRTLKDDSKNVGRSLQALLLAKNGFTNTGMQQQKRKQTVIAFCWCHKHSWVCLFCFWAVTTPPHASQKLTSRL